MFCTHCGSRNGEYDRFCTSCGAKLEEMPPAGVNAPHNGTDEGSVDQIPSVQEPMQDATGDAESQVVTESASEPVQPEHSQPALPQPDVARSKPAQSEPDVTHDADEAGETDETDGEADDFDTIPLQSVADEVVEAVDEPAQDEPAQNTEAASIATDSTDSVANGKSKSRLSRRGVVLVVVAVVVLVAAVVAGVVTYRMELWGGRSLPRVSAGSSVSGRVPSARSVAKQLGDRGFKASRKQVFSGERKGAFLGYEGARGGERVRAGQRVVVRESAGPGVPSDTVGRQASVVAGELRGMGVPVRYKQVAVSKSGKIAPGSVVATYPEPGYGVTDTKTGIYVGVAVRSDAGLPADIVGRGVSDVKADLEAKGYTVKTEKRLSSKKYVGKVSGSVPGPGSKLSDGQTVTLYEGVDAKGAKQSYALKYSDLDNNALLAGSSTVVEGRWCANSGSCITLSSEEAGANVFRIKVTEGGSGKEDGIDDSVLVSCDVGQQFFCHADGDDYLLQGDTGAFELFPRRAYDGYWCGSSFIITNSVALQRCKAGVPVDNDLDSDYEDISGGEYRMMNYFMVAPVGTDLKALESKGYFDTDALKSASAQKSVDTSRPFLLYRDPKLYKTTTANVDGDSLGKNPFVPMHGDGGKNMVRMKPAPSDATAYYLVESTQPDWDTLADAKVKGVTNAKQGKPLNAALFSNIAGQYVYYQSGDGSLLTYLTVGKDGSFTGDLNVADLDHGASVATAPRIKMPFHGRFSSIEKNSLGGYDMQCDASSVVYKGEKEYKDSIGVIPCTTWHWYPPNTSFDSMTHGSDVITALEINLGTMDEDRTSWNTAILTNDGGAYNAYVPREE
ncbi:serine/threonine protein kinase [Bifidobacterium sp. DSM 109960]|uniref:Serine/threonine protein kinase n=1 Tax=Bifidobacterium erythrocebi TaxID=2675325 RepID=A0A7Y0EUR2_9BIFI|nr:serine/threonine protein kinase [Bifidobacterium sp. DSM 109960]